MSAPTAIEPMLARSAEALPRGHEWRYEPKWDGFRCLVLADGTDLRLQSRNAKPLHQIFPEVVAALRARRLPRVMDGELVIGRDGDYRASFADLQRRQRSRGERADRLARELPARLVLFDLLVAADGTDLTAQPFDRRRSALVRSVAGLDAERVMVTPQTGDPTVAERWLELAGNGIEGVVAKRSDAPYEPGRRSPAMRKVKAEHTIDCVVGGIAAEGRRHALLLGLYEEAGGPLHYVGQSTPVAPALMRRIEQALDGAEGGGFDGRRPAEQHRWSKGPRAAWRAVPPRVVVEVGYDRLDTTFRHRPRVLRLRHDKEPADCRMDQPRPAA